MRAIPEPVLGAYPRKKKPDLKPLVQVPVASAPAPAAQKPAGNEPGNKPELKAAKMPEIAAKLPENQVKSGKIPEKAAGNEAETKPQQPETKKQERPLPPDALPPEGQGIPPLFQPVDPLTALSSSNPAVALVMLRQLRDLQGPMPDTSNGAVAIIDKIEQGIKNGEDITALSDEIAVHIMSGDDHNELLMRLNDSVDRQRANEILKSRSKLEDFWHGCMRRSDLNIIESMALTGYFNGQLDKIMGRIERRHTKGETSSGRDPGELVARVNIPTQIENKQLQRKFDEASPQEREILRKLGFKLERALAARITKTTTETVEIVQQPDAADIPV